MQLIVTLLHQKQFERSVEVAVSQNQELMALISLARGTVRSKHMSASSDRW